MSTLRIAVVLASLASLTAFATIASAKPHHILLAKADPATEDAKRHFEAGATLYVMGNYAGARDEFEAARKAKPLPDLDYNIARCEDRLGHAEAAIVSYERFLSADPDAVDSAAVRGRIAALKTAVPAVVSLPSDASVAPLVRAAKTAVAPVAPATPSLPPALLLLDVRAMPAAIPEIPVASTSTVAPQKPLDNSAPLVRQWWLWTATGLVAGSGVALGAGLGLQHPESPLPPTTDGTYSVRF